MKKLLLVLFCAGLCVAKAQFTELKGLTFCAKKIIYADKGEIKTEETFQLFNFSFIDKTMTHNIITESIESQLYKLQNIEKSFDESTKKTKFKMEAVSGLSGNTYKYEININSEGVAEVSLNGYLYTGGSYKFKTYVQE
ncbi:MAG: hypothetical protein H0W61_11320 [Bacteroidetes bacterium]|nr:hypothetical protein [Bacteroidota bacterium]